MTLNSINRCSIDPGLAQLEDGGGAEPALARILEAKSALDAMLADLSSLQTRLQTAVKAHELRKRVLETGQAL